MDDDAAAGRDDVERRSAHLGEQGSSGSLRKHGSDEPRGRTPAGHDRDQPRGGPHLTEQSLSEVLARMSATEPGPAAGSAAAISAAMAAALVAKTARLSHRQLPDGAEVATSAQKLRERALDLAQADAAGVRAMITGEDPPDDPSAIPQQIGAIARQVSDLATDVHTRGKASLRADAKAALNLARAAIDTIAAILASNADRER